jgi:hypothetical protein
MAGPFDGRVALVTGRTAPRSRGARAEPPPTAAERRGWHQRITQVLPALRPRPMCRPVRGDGPCRMPSVTRQARGSGEEVKRRYRVR